MTHLTKWKRWFNANGIVTEDIESNLNAVILSNLVGSPIFRVVGTVQELNDLHAKARMKSEEMQRLLAVGLPIDHPLTMVQLPGEMLMPRVRVYAGNIASTFNLGGHLIECTFLKELKKEVLNVMTNGIKTKTPLCDWLIKLAGKSWVYGTPSGLSQLDSLLSLVSRDTAMIGHLRTRQLSFGRGCGDALLLPINGVVLKNNNVGHKISPFDYRFISLETEVAQRDASRDRIYAQQTDIFLTVLNNPEMGTEANIGASKLGEVKTAPVVALDEPAQRTTVSRKINSCVSAG